MKKNKRHLGFYNTFMRDGKLPCDGLCRCAKNGYVATELLQLFFPTADDLEALLWENKYTGYWGCDYEIHPVPPNTDECIGIAKAFTPLRQNIILFMAAMNNEL